jgi:hypothetical protein
MTMSDNLATAAFGDKRNPKQLLIDALPKMGEAEVAMIVYRDQDGLVQTAWSDGPLTERVGLLEIAKLQMIESARE